jgi:hypothetical protein|tara:strand:+ start:5455 stop:5814 length:360 start_codon:yes stop_codon:yes gene_type:complete
VALSIKKQTINYILDQGCNFEKTVTAKNANNANVTISSGSCAAKMATSHYTSNSNNIFTFTTSVTGSNVTISANATQTANTTIVRPGRYVFGVEYTQSDNVTKERICEGVITVSPESTK